LKPDKGRNSPFLREKMMNPKIDVLNFIRRDGLIEAPILFLTIEDGEGLHSSAEFMKYFADDEVWEPKCRNEKYKGKPGQIISKIVVGTFLGNLNEWREYRKYLYINNECNIKYYPIARKKTEEWKEYYTDLTGLSRDQYLALCDKRRAAIIWEKYRSLFDSEKFIIILGGFAKWGYFLNKYVYKEVSLKGQGEEADEKGKTKWSFYLDNKGKLLYSYFNMFRWGLKNDDILDYCKKLIEYIPSDIKPHIIGNIKSFF
jgi:hypothetical protein